MDENYLAALKRERAVYEQSGNTDRMKQVDAEIARVQGDKLIENEERSEPPVEAKPKARKQTTRDR